MEFGSMFSRVNGDGDGTVNIRSLQACSMWENDINQGGKPIIRKTLKEVQHYDILKDPQSINYILKLLTGIGNYTKQPTVNLTLTMVLNQSHAKAIELLKKIQFRLL